MKRELQPQINDILRHEEAQQIKFDRQISHITDLVSKLAGACSSIPNLQNNVTQLLSYAGLPGHALAHVDSHLLHNTAPGSALAASAAISSASAVAVTPMEPPPVVQHTASASTTIPSTAYVTPPV